MNTAFKLYGKQPSTEMEKEALIVQAKYDLTDAQISGLLMIYDFFKNLTIFDHSATLIEVVKYGYKENKKVELSRGRLPLKTREFFSNVKKCSDLSRFFSGVLGHTYFQRFADRILSNINSTKEYIAEGSLEPMTINFVEKSYEVAA